jgi:DNA-binding beta-propeller fold protein YncE
LLSEQHAIRHVFRRHLPPLSSFILLLTGCGPEKTTQVAPPSCSDPNVLCTVMGTGDWGYGGEGVEPKDVTLYWPIDLAFDSEGRLLVLDWNNNRVRRLDHDGRVRTVLGTGSASIEVVNGTPALLTPLHHAFSMCFDESGRLFVAGYHTHSVIRKDADELVWTVAGVASPGYEGDGGPAVEALLNIPCGVAVAEGGYPIYVADTSNHCIRSVDAQGIISTIAGNGLPGALGDGGPATQAQLSSPIRVRSDPATGSIYVTDQGNHKIRRIDAAGIITTIAGGSSAGYSGDGSAAVGALLNLPSDARIGPDGNLYIADTNNHRIRRVDHAGGITTVVGSGYEGTRLDAQESGPALTVNLRSPSAIVFDIVGDLFIADTYNSVVRRVQLQP